MCILQMQKIEFRSSPHWVWHFLVGYNSRMCSNQELWQYLVYWSLWEISKIGRLQTESAPALPRVEYSSNSHCPGTPDCQCKQQWRGWCSCNWCSVNSIITNFLQSLAQLDILQLVATLECSKINYFDHWVHFHVSEIAGNTAAGWLPDVDEWLITVNLLSGTHIFFRP